MKVLKIFLVLMVSVGVFVLASPNLYADETSEVILRLLIKKGIISQKEVDAIKAEVAESEPQLPQTITERVAKLEQKQGSLPAWIENTKLKGDFRLRNEYIEIDPGSNTNRQRIRLRVGLETKLSDMLKVAFGVATGSSDTPTSTNQTLEKEFQSKNIWLDYAYVNYAPFDWLNLTGGKFKSPFFHSDLLWDSDIRFDGFAAGFNRQLNPLADNPTSVYLTAGYFPIDDANSTGDDIYLLATQLGTKSKFADYAKLETGVAFYNFHGLKGVTAASLSEERGTNTYNGTYASGSTTATLANDFQVISPGVKLSFQDIFGLIDTPWGVLGEYAANTDASSNDQGWRVGLWLGKSKAKHKGDWKLIGQYSRLEKDVFFDVFPDSDFNNAGTDGKGWEVIFDYVLTDNTIFSMDYYNTESVSGANADQQILQTDLIFKF